MVLYNNDSLTDTPREYLPASRADEKADTIADYLLNRHLYDFIIVIYSRTKNKNETARICRCSSKTVDRVIKSLEKMKPKGLDISHIAMPVNMDLKPLFKPLDNIKGVMDILKPFLPSNDGDPNQLGINIEELDTTIAVLKKLATQCINNQ